jgi:Leucine-rich repeat (LRR) protein
MLGAGLAAGWVSYEIRMAKFEQEQIKKLKVLGEVTVTYHFQFNSEGSVDPRRKPRVLSKWLSFLTGDQPIYRGVRWLSISHGEWDEDWPQLSDEQLAEAKQALSHFTRLETFSSDIYPWEDLDPFKNTTGLKHLSIDAFPINIDGLSKLTQLESLVLGDCWELTDISPLANCVNLKSLDISCCESMADLSPIKTLTKLRHLDISRCDLTSLKGIEHFKNLVTLEAGYCVKVEDIEGLGRLKKLTSLTLTDTVEKCDLSPISNLTSLKELQLSDNAQVKLEQLSSLTQLEELSLENCEFSTLNGLQDFRELHTLHISGSPVQDVSAIFGLPKLTFIGAAGTRLSDEQINELKNQCPNASVMLMRMF